MKKKFIHFLLAAGLLIVACNGDDGANPLGNNNSDGAKAGFGVSGLLFENNRVEQTQPLFPLLTRSLDSRFPPKHTVLGLIAGGVQKAFPFSKLAGKPVVNDKVNGREVVIVSELAAKLAIPYDRKVNGQTLSFRISSENPFAMTDNETGSVWNLKGEAISGALAGAKLAQIPAYNAFWFAWAVFWPATEIFAG